MPCHCEGMSMARWGLKRLVNLFNAQKGRHYAFNLNELCAGGVDASRRIVATRRQTASMARWGLKRLVNLFNAQKGGHNAFNLNELCAGGVDASRRIVATRRQTVSMARGAVNTPVIPTVKLRVTNLRSPSHHGSLNTLAESSGQTSSEFSSEALRVVAGFWQNQSS